MTLGDRVAVMYEGHIQQLDAPQRLYNDPANTLPPPFCRHQPTLFLRSRERELAAPAA
jgi:ABC-type sugar transport system ATPase subunit